MDGCASLLPTPSGSSSRSSRNSRRTPMSCRPFSGTAPTPCVPHIAQDGDCHGYQPFLVWLARAKARVYDTASIESFEQCSATRSAQCLGLPGLAGRCPPSVTSTDVAACRADILLRLKAAIDALKLAMRRF